MGHPFTPDRTKTSSTFSFTPIKDTHLNQLRLIFDLNNLYVKDNAAGREYAALITQAKEIINGGRESAVKTESRTKLMKNQNRMLIMNEDTFMIKMLGSLIGSGRYIQPSQSKDEKGKDAVQNTAGICDCLKRDWIDDGLDFNANQEFHKTRVPSLEITNGPVHSQLLDALPRIKTPKPDRVFGLLLEAFGPEDCLILATCSKQTSLTLGLYHFFFLIEAKVSSGDMVEAMYRACRGGAALSNAMRELILISDPQIAKDKIEPQTIVFSLTIGPEYAKLWIHWAEIDPGKQTRFQMQSIAKYWVDETNDVRKLRHDIDNILDWGTFTRKQTACKIMDTIRHSVQIDTRQ